MYYLKPADNQLIIDLYSSNKKRKDVELELSNYFNVSKRQVRTYAQQMGLTFSQKNVVDSKVMVYDIETSRVTAKLWSTGKQYVKHNSLKSETTIISIAWKWVGESKVYSLTWDKNHCDKKMLEIFLKEYNKASMIIGQNNNSFDNKLINTRAAKHRLFVDRYVKSFDIYRMAKRYFRLPSFSMAYMAQYFGLTLKQSHEGLYMWDMIEDGTVAQQKEYLKKMVDYNKGDIVTTEELYITLKPYFASVTNKAVSQGSPKWGCPVSGSLNVKLFKTIFTEQGTVQRILICEDSMHQYKVNNKVYQDFLTRRMVEFT